MKQKNINEMHLKTAKSINENIIADMFETLSSLEQITVEQQLELIERLKDLKTILENINVTKPYHGEKPLFGYMDLEQKIPFVKTEFVMDYISQRTNIPRGKLKNHHIWKYFKLWLKENFNLEHVWKSPAKIDGVMVIYENIDVENMISIINEFFNDNNFRKED